MTDYKFSVTLFISHPVIKGEEISSALKLDPVHCNNVGEIKKTKKGILVSEKNYGTKWSYYPHGKERLCADDITLEDYLVKLNNQLSIHSEYFSKIVQTGGYIEYFIGWFGGDYSMIVSLEPNLLKTTANLNIAIGLDVYPKEE